MREADFDEECLENLAEAREGPHPTVRPSTILSKMASLQSAASFRSGAGAKKYMVGVTWEDSVLLIGKHARKTVSEILKEDPGYFSWLERQDFGDEFAHILRETRQAAGKR